MSRNRIHTLTVSLAAFALLSLLSVAAQAQQVQTKGIGGVKVGLGKPPSPQIMSVYPGSDGKLDLGRLEEGTYTLTFSLVTLAPPPATCEICKTFYDSRSNTAKYSTTIEGAKSGPIVIVIDFERNVMFNAHTMSFEPIRPITFTVSGYDVLTGRITPIPPPTLTPIPSVN